MATVRYTLRKPQGLRSFNSKDGDKSFDAKSDNETPILLNFLYGQIKIIMSTGKKIRPSYWQFDKNSEGYQRAKKTKLFPTHPELNRHLNKLKLKAEEKFMQFQNDNDRTPTESEFRPLLKTLIDGVTKAPDKPKALEFYQFYDLLIKEMQSGIYTTPKGTSYAKSTIRTYNDVLSYLKDYDDKLKFDSIDLEFYKSLKNYANNERGNQNGYFGKIIKTVKAVMNEAVERGLTDNMKFKSKYFKTIHEKTDSIALTEYELQELIDLDLSNNRRLENARDLFIIMCYTGLRVSDLKQLRESFIDRDSQMINIQPQKTQERIAIPILKPVEGILDKYTHQNTLVLKPIADSNLNEYIKEVGEACSSLQRKETLFIGTVGDKKKYVTQERFAWLSNHVGRRTFATLMYKNGVPTYSIMQVTGHKTEASFLRYIKMSSTEHAEIMRQHFEKQGSNEKIRSLRSA